MRIYKVVRKQGRHLVSLHHHDRGVTCPFCVRYREGQWVEAPVGGLFAVSRLLHAVDFPWMVLTAGARIYEAEGMEIVHPPEFLPCHPSVCTEEDIRAIWNGEVFRLRPDARTTPQQGTVFVRRLKLVRRIQPERVKVLSRREELFRFEGEEYVVRKAGRSCYLVEYGDRVSIPCPDKKGAVWVGAVYVCQLRNL